MSATSILARRRGEFKQAGGPEITLVGITPALAEKWLEKNLMNRRVNDPRVEAMAADMASHSWRLTGDPIQFDTNGILIDGQKRLHAILRSGVTVRMFVAVGLEPEAREVIDTGEARSAAQALTMLDGAKDSSVLASVTKAAISWERSPGASISAAARVTHSQIRDFINDPTNAYIFRAAEVGRYGYRKVPITPAALGLAFFICAQKDPEMAEAFYVHDLIDNIELTFTAPANALRRKLESERLYRGHAANGRRLAACIQGWNAYRAGKAVRSLPAPKQGWTVENFPRPE